MKIRKFRNGFISFMLAAVMVIGLPGAALADDSYASSQVSITDETTGDADAAEDNLNSDEIADPEDEQESSENEALPEENGSDPSEDADSGENDQTDIIEDTDPESSEETGAEEGDEQSPEEDTDASETENDADNAETGDITEETAQPAADAEVKISGKFTDETKTSYRIVISGLTVGDGDTVEAGVYSKKKGTDDLVWIPLTKKSSGRYVATFSLSQFKNSGAFIANIYINRETLVITKTFKVPALSSDSVSVTSVNTENGTAVINAQGISSVTGVQSVYAVAWSKSDRSDSYTYDLVQKSAGNYSATLKIKNHNSNKAKYAVAFYAKDGNGFLYYLGRAYADLSEKQAQAVIKVKSSGKYYVYVSGISNAASYSTIRAYVWSDEGGQDDVTQHDLTLSGGKYCFDSKLKDMKHYGKCYVHIYGIKADGTSEYIVGESFTTTAPAVEKVTASVASNGKFTVTAKNLTNSYVLSSVKVAVWSADNQADLKWYTATAKGTSYVISDYISNHQYRSGKYVAHVYAYTTNGPAVCVGGTTFTVKKSTGTIAYRDLGTVSGSNMEKTYKLTLSGLNLPDGVSKVEFAVWNTSDTSNIRWYDAKVTSKGVFYTKVSISSFKKLGQYVTHVYVTDCNGKKSFLQGTEVMNVLGTAEGNVKTYDANNTYGTFKLLLSNPSAPSGIKSVRFAVWTKSDQSDLDWYQGEKLSSGSYYAKVLIANHNYNTGKFHIQTYATMGNGIETLVAETTYLFAPENIAYIIKGNVNGQRTVGITNPSFTGNIRFAIWSEQGGQDDLYWYDGTADGTNWKATFNISNHKHPGNYIVHIYAGDTFITSNGFYVSENEFKNGWVYEDGYKFYYVNGVKKTDLTGMVSGPYQICVNRVTNSITVYAQENGNYIIPVIAFTCSVGLPGMETPLGVYYTDYKSRWELLMGPSYGQYATHVVEGIFIHSVAGVNMTSYNLDSNDYNNLGQAASHGCIRLNVRDAKWIFDNCGIGTQVYIYDSSYPGPFGKPDTIKIPDGQTWDPTDPAIQ